MKNGHSNARPGSLSFVIPAILIMVAFLLCTSAQAAVVPIDISVGKSAIHTITGADTKYKTVIISDPAIADAVIVNPKALRIRGKKAGSTDMIIYYNDGKKDTFDLNVNVDISLVELRIKELAPNDNIQVQGLKNVVIVKGTVSSKEKYDHINDLLKSIGTNITSKELVYLQGGIVKEVDNTGSADDTGIKVINMLEVIDVPQVLLQISIASVDRKAVRDLGINWAYASEKAIGVFSGVGGATSGAAVISSALALTSNGSTSPVTSTGGPQLGVLDVRNNTAYLLKALASKGLAKMLAEPNLIVKSGEQGRFKAGGSFPYPTVQSISGGTGTSSSAISVTFQDFGVIMDFKPVVRDSGIIQLNLVHGEVSSLDFANGVSIGGTQVPLIISDTLNTSVDLRDGEAFVVAGLMQDDWAKKLDKLPILGDIPILGAFFRDQHMQKEERELVFFITPKIVKATAPGAKTELPGANEPSAAQKEDQKWIPLMPNERSIDPEKVGR